MAMDPKKTVKLRMKNQTLLTDPYRRPGQKCSERENVPRLLSARWGYGREIAPRIVDYGRLILYVIQPSSEAVLLTSVVAMIGTAPFLRPSVTTVPGAHLVPKTCGASTRS